MATEDLRTRVVRAAEWALADHQYVCAIDVLTGMRLLEPVHVQSWEKGRIEILEESIQAKPAKVSAAISLLHQWAAEKGLTPAETRYMRPSRDGAVELRFTRSGTPEAEARYRVHYVSPAMPARKREKLTEKLSRPDAPVVFEILRDSDCSECGAEIGHGGFLLMEAGEPLCLACARLGDLEYLPAGDAALTRRSSKYSARSAVVVRFSRSRGRYERQGILVEKAALERAEQECAKDAGARAKAREASTARQLAGDREFHVRMAAEIERLFPNCPRGEAAAIAAHTGARSSGRVGRTEAGRNLDAGALRAAVTARIRHRHTNYDELLARGMERPMARERVMDRVQEILAEWGG